MPATLSRIGDFTPLGAFRESLEATWTGSALDPMMLATMAGVALVAGGIAAQDLPLGMTRSARRLGATGGRGLPR